MSSRTMVEMFISSYYSKVLVPCLSSMNSHSSPQFSFGFTYIEFSTILEQIIAYTRFLVLHDIPVSCITVKVSPFLNVNEVPSIKLGHVIHLLLVHFFTDGDDSWKSNFDDDKNSDFSAAFSICTLTGQKYFLTKIFPYMFHIKPLIFHNILMKSFLIWFSWNFQH